MSPEETRAALDDIRARKDAGTITQRQVDEEVGALLGAKPSTYDGTGSQPQSVGPAQVSREGGPQVRSATVQGTYPPLEPYLSNEKKTDADRIAEMGALADQRAATTGESTAKTFLDVAREQGITGGPPKGPVDEFLRATSRKVVRPEDISDSPISEDAGLSAESRASQLLRNTAILDDLATESVYQEPGIVAAPLRLGQAALADLSRARNAFLAAAGVPNATPGPEPENDPSFLQAAVNDFISAGSRDPGERRLSNADPRPAATGPGLVDWAQATARRGERTLQQLRSPAEVAPDAPTLLPALTQDYAGRATIDDKGGKWVLPEIAQDLTSAIGYDPTTGKNVFTGEKIPTVENRVLGTTPADRGLSWVGDKGGIPGAWSAAMNQLYNGGGLPSDFKAASAKAGGSPEEQRHAEELGFGAALATPFWLGHALRPIYELGQAAVEGARVADATGYSRVAGAWSGFARRGRDLVGSARTDLENASREGRAAEYVDGLAPELQADLDAAARQNEGRGLREILTEVDAPEQAAAQRGATTEARAAEQVRAREDMARRAAQAEAEKGQAAKEAEAAEAARLAEENAAEDAVRSARKAASDKRLAEEAAKTEVPPEFQKPSLVEEGAKAGEEIAGDRPFIPYRTNRDIEEAWKERGAGQAPGTAAAIAEDPGVHSPGLFKQTKIDVTLPRYRVVTPDGVRGGLTLQEAIDAVKARGKNIGAGARRDYIDYDGRRVVGYWHLPGDLAASPRSRKVPGEFRVSAQEAHPPEAALVKASKIEPLPHEGLDLPTFIRNSEGSTDPGRILELGLHVATGAKIHPRLPSTPGPLSSAADRLGGYLESVLTQRMNRFVNEGRVIDMGHGVRLPEGEAKRVLGMVDKEAALAGVDMKAALQDPPAHADALKRWLAGYDIPLRSATVEGVRAAHEEVVLQLAAQRSQAIDRWAEHGTLASALLDGVRSALGIPEGIGAKAIAAAGEHLKLNMILGFGSNDKDWSLLRWWNQGKLSASARTRLLKLDSPMTRLRNNAIDLAGEVRALKGKGMTSAEALLNLAGGKWSPGTTEGELRAQVSWLLESMAPDAARRGGKVYEELPADRETLLRIWSDFVAKGYDSPILKKTLDAVLRAPMENPPDVAATLFLLKSRANTYRKEITRFLIDQGLALPQTGGVRAAMEDIAANGLAMRFDADRVSVPYTKAEFYAANRLFNTLGKPWADKAVEFAGPDGLKAWTYGVIDQYVKDVAREGLASPEQSKSLAAKLGRVAAKTFDATAHFQLFGLFGTRLPAYALGLALGHIPTLMLTQETPNAVSMAGRLLTGGAERANNFRPVVLELTSRVEGPTGLFAEATRDAQTFGPHHYRMDEMEAAIRRLGLARQTTPLDAEKLFAVIGDVNPKSQLGRLMREAPGFAGSSAQRVAGTLELYGRVGVFVDEVERGASLEQAADVAKRALYSLDGATPLERTVIRRAYMFYHFDRADTLNAAWALAHNPERVFAAFSYFRNQPALWGIPQEEWQAQSGQGVAKVILAMGQANDAGILRRDGSVDPRKATWMFMSPTVGPSSLLEHLAMGADSVADRGNPLLVWPWEAVSGVAAPVPGSRGMGHRVFADDSREMHIPAPVINGPAGTWAQWAFSPGLVLEPDPDKADVVIAGTNEGAKWVAGAGAQAGSRAQTAAKQLWLAAQGPGGPVVQAMVKLGRANGTDARPWVPDAVEETSAATGLSVVPLNTVQSARDAERARGIESMKAEESALKKQTQ